MTVLHIDEAAIAHNLRMIRAHTDKQIIAVVKEDGYGIGLENAYRILQKYGIDFFGVAHASEALRLRELGAKEEILLLTPELSVRQCSCLLEKNIIFMLGSREQADILKEAAVLTKLVPRVHLAIDTGLGRYGFHWDNLGKIKVYTAGMHVEGCYTHFATASASYEKNIRRQFQRFEQSLAALASMGVNYGMTHVSATKTFLSTGDLGCDAVRIGSLLLGRCAGKQSADYRKAVCLHAPVYMKSFHKKGETIGYDGALKLRRDTIIGLVKAGYADGILLGSQDVQPSLLRQMLKKIYCALTGRSQGKYVEINGRPVPVLGKIGLNHLLVDLTDGDYDIGDEVVIDVNPIFVRRDIRRSAAAPQTAAVTEPNWVLTVNQAGLCLNRQRTSTTPAK